MSGIVRPKGGAPPSVYWRRRLILLAVVLLVTAGGFKLFGGNGDDGGDGQAQASTQPSTDGGDESSQQDRSNGTKRQKRNNRNNRNKDVSAGERDVAVDLGADGTCDPATVTVTPSLAVDSHAGGPVTLRLAFSTTADTACKLSLSEHEPLVSISDGSDLVWESERCDELIDTDRVRVGPGWRTYVDAAWSGRASRHTCGENADFAEPGSYDVKAAVLGGEPTSATVELAKRPEPDKSNKGKKDKKQDKKQQNEKQDDEKQDDENETQDDTSAQAD